jgi:hypothetical protein
VLLALPVSSSLTWSFYLTKSTSYEAPHYTVISVLLLLHIFSASYSQIPSVYVLLISEAKFHGHAIERNSRIKNCVSVRTSCIFQLHSAVLYCSRDGWTSSFPLYNHLMCSVQTACRDRRKVLFQSRLLVAGFLAYVRVQFQDIPCGVFDMDKAVLRQACLQVFQPSATNYHFVNDPYSSVYNRRM